MNFVQAIRKSKVELYEAFARYSDFWWKEEDLQSFLYHLLLEKLGEKETAERVHREYPLYLKRSGKKKEFGHVDLVILEPLREEFDAHIHKIKHAIELKFPRKKQDGTYLTTKSQTKKGFARSYYEDYGKLWQADDEAENVANNNFQKHILFFQKLDKESEIYEEIKNQSEEPHKIIQKIKQCIKSNEDYLEERFQKKKKGNSISKYRKWIEFKEKNFDDIQFSYMEVYREKPDSDSYLVHNWEGRPKVKKISP